MAPTRVFHGLLSTCQDIEFYRCAFLTSLLYITMDKSDDLIAEVMDDKKATHQQQKEQRKQETKASAVGAHHKWNHTTVNVAKVQPTTDIEIAATKTAQEEINDKNWDHTNGQLLMIFKSHST
jgi:hypothetical protein